MSKEFMSVEKLPLQAIDLVRYAGASGDFNEIHTIPEAAKRQGLGEPIAHGMLLMGWAADAISQWFPDRKLKKFTVRFVGMAHAGERFTIEGALTTAHAGELQIKDGTGAGKLIGSFELE